MKNIDGFKIDKWAQKYSPGSRIDLHGSYASALSINDLQHLVPNTKETLFDADLKLTYGPIQGSVRLRGRIAELHSTAEVPLTADNVVITPGSIMANYLVLTTLLVPGDHIICQYPTYGQLYALPRYNGVEVTLWAAKEENGWTPDVRELAGLIKPNTKAIIINNPSNPTGSVIFRDQLEQIVSLARMSNLTVFADEVFRPLFYAEGPPPPGVVALGYARTVSTGSVSKAYSLPGVRIGWVVSPDVEFLEQIMTARDYTTLAVSQLDDSVAAYALSKDVGPAILQRNMALCTRSIELVDDLVKRHAGRCSWVKPNGAGTAFIKILNPDGSPVDAYAFSVRLAEVEGVTVIPGEYSFSDDNAGDFKGYIRMTLGSPEKLEEALPVLEKLLQESG